MSGDLPETYKEWVRDVRERKLEGKTVHAAELASGSKIEYEQFLLLRVLWKVYPRIGTPILPDKLAQLLPMAEKMLTNYQSWRIYCGSFLTAMIPEGSFSIARHYQIMAANNKETISPNSFDTPIAMRTRSKLKDKLPDISKLRLNTPKTPSKQPTKEPRTPVLDSSSDDDDNLVLEEESPSPPPATPAAQVPEELQKLMFPRTKDEQIVNMALVVFLNALTVHFDISKTCNWTPHRKGFLADFKQASFEARTDGYLDDGQENAYALIEVKPIIRSLKQNAIQMQESAQMVGWIKNDTSDKMRIHVSQDRQEIFLTFAEYDDDYLAYLNDKTPRSTAPSFLTMHQYGPWDTENPSDMAKLGPILLAIALYADAEIRAKQSKSK